MSSKTLDTGTILSWAENGLEETLIQVRSASEAHAAMVSRLTRLAEDLERNGVDSAVDDPKIPREYLSSVVAEHCAALIREAIDG